MKTLRYFTIALIAMFLIATLGTVTWAAPGPGPGPEPNSKECGLIGTWFGHAGSSMAWLGIHTPGSKDAKNGEMLMNWVYIDSGLLGGSATSMTPGHGVWEQIGKGQYRYTWYTYGIDLSLSSDPLFSVRVSGLATNADCDNINISYKYEIFYPAVYPQDMSGATPYDTITGSAAETRVPLTVTP